MALKNLLLYCMIAFFVLTTTIFAVLFMLEYSKSADLGERLSDKTSELQGSESRLSDAESTIDDRNREISLLKSDISGLTTDLEAKNSEIIRLGSELNRTEAELEETKDTLENAEAEIGEIRDEATAMDERINQSIQWFTDNSNLPSRLKTDRFISKVENGCVSHDEVNLACISYQMTEELGFSYKSDPTGDRLYSIDEILSRKGGDCEDYALFFKAVLNYLDESGKDLEAWEDGTGRYLVYEDWSTYTRWYFEDANGVPLGDAGSMNPYSACFFYDTEDPFWQGHCIIMLSGKNISSPSDISDEKLADAVFFEPQNGKYLGRMGAEFLTCQDGEDGCEAVPFHIVFIITDNDLFQFSDGRWNHYEGYRDRIGELLADLDKIRTT